MFKLTPSRINTYKLCPFKYKCEIDTYIRNQYRKDTPELVFGNLIHGCLNDYFKRINEEERNFETLRKLYEVKFKANFIKHKNVFKTKENIISYIKQAHEQFHTFLESPLKDGKPLLLEEFPKYSLNSDLELGGKFDRVDLDEGELVLIDYKTGKYRDENQEDTTLQLNFYEYILAKKYSQYKLKKKILFYLKENKIIEFDNKTNLKEIEEYILKTATIMMEDKLLSPKRNALCRYCDYRVICPIWKE